MTSRRSSRRTPKAAPPPPAASSRPQTSADGFLSRVQLAVAFEVKPKTITDWTNEGMPVEIRGGSGRESRYRLAAVVRWTIARELKRLGAVGDDARTPQQEKARLDRLRADSEELKLQERRGELVDPEAFEREWRPRIKAAVARLMLVPDQLVTLGLISPARVMDVRDTIADALREISTPSASAPETAA